MRTNSLYRDNTSWGRWQIAGIARKLGYERLNNGYSGYEFGWGFNASSVINTFGRDQLKLQLAYGEGNGNYFNDGGLDIAPDSTDLNNADATAVQILGIVAYYEHYWSEKWSTSVGWSMTDLDTEDSQPLDEFKKGQIATANLLYYPASNVTRVSNSPRVSARTLMAKMVTTTASRFRFT